MKTSILCSFAAALALSACNAAPRAPVSEMQVPAGFDFKTTRAVSVSISATAAALGAASGTIRVNRADGKTMFTGNIGAGQPLSFRMPVAGQEPQLFAVLSKADGTTVRLPMAIASGAASAEFR